MGRDSIPYNISLLKYQWRDVAPYSYCRNDPLEYVDIDGFRARYPGCLPVNKPGNISNPNDWDPVNPDFAKAKYGNYCGAGTDLLIGCEPVSDLDNCCKSHDFCYLKYGIDPFGDDIDDNTEKGKKKACCDKKLCKCNEGVNRIGGGGSLDPEINPTSRQDPYWYYSNALSRFFKYSCKTIKKADEGGCPASTNTDEYPELTK